MLKTFAQTHKPAIFVAYRPMIDECTSLQRNLVGINKNNRGEVKPAPIGHRATALSQGLARSTQE